MLLVVVSFLGGCAGNQPVVWNDATPIEEVKFSAVEVEALVEIPQYELDFMKDDITKKLSSSDFWSDIPSDYTLKVVISEYEEGNAFARFMLIGLGQMHLNGTVDLLAAGNPPEVIKSGSFEKNYALGGFMGASANMHDDMTSKLGKAIYEALNNPSNTDS